MVTVMTHEYSWLESGNASLTAGRALRSHLMYQLLRRGAEFKIESGRSGKVEISFVPLGSNPDDERYSYVTISVDEKTGQAVSYGAGVPTARGSVGECAGSVIGMTNTKWATEGGTRYFGQIIDVVTECEHVSTVLVPRTGVCVVVWDDGRVFAVKSQQVTIYSSVRSYVRSTSSERRDMDTRWFVVNRRPWRCTSEPYTPENFADELCDAWSRTRHE